MSLARRIAKGLRWPLADILFLGTTWWRLFWIGRRLRGNSFIEVYGALAGPVEERRRGQEDAGSCSVYSPGRLCGFVRQAAIFYPAGSCLVQALTGMLLLQRAGYHPRLHIGTRKRGCDGLEGHAWLSLDGRVVLGWLPELEEFDELPLESALLAGGGVKF